MLLTLTTQAASASFAFQSPVHTPNGTAEIQNFRIGDPVIKVTPGDAGAMKLSTERVNFSSGTSEQNRQTMVYLVYGNDQSVIATPDQLFLLSSGKLKRADQLVLGLDRLVAPDGSSVEIYLISIGTYQGGVHHIAINGSSADGNLIVVSGVVVGDYAKQIHYHGGDQSNQPSMGTAEY